METGPIDAGGDLERLLQELRSKGWSPEKIRATREVWEDVCHDPMRRGRGGKGIPENERVPEAPKPHRLPSLGDFLERTATFPEDPPVIGKRN